MKRKSVKIIVFSVLFLISCSLLFGCSEENKEKEKCFTPRPSIMKLIDPATQKDLNEIPMPRYAIRVRDDQGKKRNLEFNYPWSIAVARISNESGAYDTAPAGQVNYSSLVGFATRKYFFNSLYRSGMTVIQRDPDDRENMRKMLMELSGESAAPRPLLENLTPFSKESMEFNINRKLEAPDLYLSGALVEVTAAEASSAAGITIAGFGVSGKKVSVSFCGSCELTDLYTGEQLVSVMAYNVVTLSQIGFEAFKIVSWFGGEEYFNVEFVSAKDLSKHRAQVELVDFLIAEALTKLYKERGEYLSQRILYRSGMICFQGMRLAEQKGLTVVKDENGRPIISPIFSEGQSQKQMTVFDASRVFYNSGRKINDSKDENN